MRALRPYVAAFASRFLQMLQYRSAALAGFATQCWWGGIKVMVLAAFYAQGAHDAAAPITLADAITYTWIAQGLLALMPWTVDPEVAAAVRSGTVAYDRLRPVGLYGLWFARTAGWIAARALPRVALMLAFAGALLPLIGADAWAWQPPRDVIAGLAFAASTLLALLLSAAVVTLLNIANVATLNERGINVMAAPWVIVLTGNLLPLSLLPDAWQPLLIAQPLAGLLDIPMRLYTGQWQDGAALGGLALQLGWLVVLAAAGSGAMTAAMRRLEVQGG